MALAVDPFITILAPGVAVASTGTTSAVTAIPNNLSGNKPVKVRVSATVAACIRFGVAGVVATASDTMVQPGDAAWFRIPSGVTSFAVIQQTAPGVVQVSPCEDA